MLAIVMINIKTIFLTLVDELLHDRPQMCALFGNRYVSTFGDHHTQTTVVNDLFFYPMSFV